MANLMFGLTGSKAAPLPGRSQPIYTVIFRPSANLAATLALALVAALIVLGAALELTW